MKLIDEWKHAWKFLSVQLSAMAAAIPVIYINLPDDFRSSIPHRWVLIATSVTAGCALVGRFVSQTPPADK